VSERKNVYYVRDPDGGLEEHDSYDDAKNAAESLLQHYRENAPDDGWPSDIDCLEWGMLVPVETAVVDEKPAPEGSGFDSFWEVRLKEVGSE